MSGLPHKSSGLGRWRTKKRNDARYERFSSPDGNGRNILTIICFNNRRIGKGAENKYLPTMPSRRRKSNEQ